MKRQFSDVKIVSPVPVSISIVAICDISVLVGNEGDCYYFPYKYVDSVEENVQKIASEILSEHVDAMQHFDKWIPVDIRTGARKNIDGISTLEIGYMTILNFVDLPEIKTEGFKWLPVNLDEKKFSVPLCMDHGLLWESLVEMFSLMK